MRIRRAQPGDLVAVGEITVAAYVPFVTGTEDSYVGHLRDAGRRDREAELWVALDDDDRVVGTVTTCPVGSPWREVARPGEGEFRMLAVDPAAQGAGVGAALVAHVVADCRTRGDDAVVLSSLPDMGAAHRVYARQGFRRTPERDWSPSPGVHLITFRRELEEAGADEDATVGFTVTDLDTAVTVGSGSLPVLGTPRLLAWCEAATCAALEPLLAPGTTSVGTVVSLQHLAASAVGQRVEVTASPLSVEGRRHRFAVVARHRARGEVVATGEVTRVVVDVQRFLERVSEAAG